MWKYRLLLSPSCSQHSPKHQQQYKKVSSSARVVSIKTLTHYLSWWTSEWEWQGQTMIGLVRKNCKRNPDHLLISDLLPKRQQSSSDVFSAYNTVAVKTKMSNKLWFCYYLSWSIMAKTSPTSSLAFFSSNTLNSSDLKLLCLLQSQAGIHYSNLAIARRNSSTSTVPDLEIRIPKCCTM